MRGNYQAYRAIVFVMSVVAALGTAFFVHELESAAVANNGVWPGVVERRAQDILLRTQPLSPLNRNVVVVAADDVSVAHLGNVSQWGREVWATGLRRIIAGKPRTVVFDVALDDRTGERNDGALWYALANGGRKVVLGFGYDGTRNQWTPDDVRSMRYLEKFALTKNVALKDSATTTPWDWSHFAPPISNFTGSARGAGVFLRESDPDGVLRDARLFYRSHVAPPAPITGTLPKSMPGSPLNGSDVVLPSLAVSAVQAAYGLDKTDLRLTGDTLDFPLKHDPIQVPLDRSGKITIRSAKTNVQNLLPFSEVVNGNAGSELFRDKIVVVGITARDALGTDMHQTPRGAMPRVLITASAISSLLARNSIARSEGKDTFVTLLLVSLVAGLLLPRSRPISVTGMGFFLAGLYMVVAWGALTFANALLPILPALFLLAISTVMAVAVVNARAVQLQPSQYVTLDSHRA